MRRYLFLTAAVLALGALVASGVACSARPSLGVSEQKSETATRYGMDLGEYAVGHPVSGQSPECPNGVCAVKPGSMVVEVKGAEFPWKGVGIGLGILLLCAFGLVWFLGRKRGGAIQAAKVASILLACCALGLAGCDEKQVGEKAQDVGALVQSAGQATGLSIVALVGSLISGAGAMIAGKKASVGQKYAEGGWSKDEIDELAAALKGQGYVLAKAP